MEKFSIIIPTYKRNKYVIQAIDSVIKFSPAAVETEIIVVDDDEKSKLGKLVKEKYGDKIEYFRNRKNSGPGFSRRFGLSKATGEYIVFMDDDDFYLSNKFFTVSLSLFKKYKRLSFVGFNSYDYIEKNNKFTKKDPLRKTGYIDREKYLKEFMLGYSKPKSTFSSVFKRSSLMNSGIMNVKMLNDTVIYLRALLCGDAYLCKDYIGAYRIHLKRITGNVSQSFILENLEEKRHISYLLPFNRIAKSKWLFDQTWISVVYMFENRDKGVDLRLIKKWYFSQGLLVKCLFMSHLAKYHLKEYIGKK